MQQRGLWRGSAEASAVSRKWLDRMKPMDFSARQGTAPQPYGVYGKGAQRRMAGKGAVSC